MEWIDIVAKEHEFLNDYGQAAEAARQWARTRHRCTPEEVSRMEMALSWGARYRHHRPLVCRLTLAVAQLRSIGFEGDRIARRLRKPAATVRRTNRAGLDAIAAGLRRDGVAVRSSPELTLAGNSSFNSCRVPGRQRLPTLLIRPRIRVREPCLRFALWCA
jgi:hypothetical protein